MKHFFSIFFLIFTLFSLSAQVTMEKGDGGFLFTENGEKVLFYQSQPQSYQGKYERCHYIHPLWGVDGAVLTEDFPADHLHHRGIFWAWHQVWIDGKRIGDPWEIKDFEQNVTEVEYFLRNEGKAVLKTTVEWKSKQWMKNGEKLPYLRENSQVTIHPEQHNYRRIDFEIHLLALEDGLTIGGAENEKGYSGFSTRIVLPDDVEFSGVDGPVEPQTTPVESKGFIHISGSMEKGGRKGGIVIIDHPENPGYPQPWILRAKNSMQNAVYPGRETIALSTSSPLKLRYSLLVYSGRLNNRKIQRIIRPH